MSRDSEIKNQEMLESKPYITKNELSFLLNKAAKNLDKKITQLLKKEYLLTLKKGLYTTKAYYLLNKNRFPEFIANFLYYPSYLSLEYVLQQENLIPEAVFQYTSISLKSPRIFKNKIGVFNYRKIKESLFTGYNYRMFFQNYQIKIASKAKALFDYLYLKPFTASFSYELFSDLRINWNNFTKQDLFEFKNFALLSKSKKMLEIVKMMEEKIL